MINRGIEYTLNLEYEKAVSVFDSIISQSPDDPQGYFLKSAVYFWIYTENYGNEEIGQQFEDLSEKAIEVAEARLELNEEDEDALFYLGGTYGTLGRYYLITRSWLNAYWNGRKGKNYLEEVVELNPQYYDAYLGLGIYHYFADVLPGIVKALSFILGFKGDREKGLEELYLAMNKGTITRDEARVFLAMTFLFVENDYERALPFFKTLVERYPTNGSFVAALGRVHLNLGQRDRAMALFNRILDKNLSRPKFTQNQANYLIGEIFFKRNDFKTAQSYFYKSIENTLRAEPDNHYWTYTRGNLRIGECYEIFGQRQQAIPYYQKVLDGKSDWGKDDAEERIEYPMREIDIELIQASNYRELSKYDKALAILNKLQSQAETSEDDYFKLKQAEIYYQLGRVSFDQKKYPDTIKLFTKVLESDDIEPERILYWSHFYIAEAYRYSDNRALAATHYEEAAESEDPRLKIKIKMSIAKMPESELATPQ